MQDVLRRFDFYSCTFKQRNKPPVALCSLAVNLCQQDIIKDRAFQSCLVIVDTAAGNKVAPKIPVSIKVAIEG